eukprot:g30064.t1
MNFRELTMLAYVNMPEEQTEQLPLPHFPAPRGRQDFGDHAVGRANGGRLRCYVATKRGDLRGDTAQQLQDLEPLGGRAVIFRSKDLLHEVLPSFYNPRRWQRTPVGAMSAAPLLPPGLEAKTAEVQDTMMPEVNAHDSMLQAMRDAVLLEVERSILVTRVHSMSIPEKERTEQLWAKGKQAFQQAQQKHREEVQRLTEEVAQCQERHKVLAEENDRLREALQSILTKCSSLAPGLAESLLSPASTFAGTSPLPSDADTCSHPSRPYSPYTPGMDFYSNEVLLPEVPPLPFGKPGVACGSPAPLSLAEALGPRVNPLRLSLAESLGDTAHVEKSGEKTWEITISKTTDTDL